LLEEKNKIKLVAIDLDGTLLDSRSIISDRNKNAIKKCLGLGISIVIATAKSVHWVKGLIKRLALKDPQISSSGAAIIGNNGQIISTKPIPQDLFKRLVTISRENDVGFGASCIDGFVYYERKDPYLEYVWETGELPKYSSDLCDDKISKQVLLIVYTVDKDHPVNEIVMEELGQKLEIKRAGTYYLTGHNRGTSKLIALKQILEDKDIDSSNTMAIGDSESDMEIMEFAGVGVAMGNSPEDVKDAADLIVSDNDNDGVAEALERLVL
jgi:Cof subfamily protein (haloacid dehalogenase superfamily)